MPIRESGTNPGLSSNLLGPETFQRCSRGLRHGARQGRLNFARLDRPGDILVAGHRVRSQWYSDCDECHNYSSFDLA